MLTLFYCFDTKASGESILAKGTKVGAHSLAWGACRDENPSPCSSCHETFLLTLGLGRGEERVSFAVVVASFGVAP